MDYNLILKAPIYLSYLVAIYFSFIQFRKEENLNFKKVISIFACFCFFVGILYEVYIDFEF